MKNSGISRRFLLGRGTLLTWSVLLSLQLGLTVIPGMAQAGTIYHVDASIATSGNGLTKKGIKNLINADISPKIDLLIGLPGDDPAGFRASVDFLVDNELYRDIQIFPLSILPGTDFRSRGAELHLNYQRRPPYTVIETPSFSPEEMLEVFCYAEDRFDLDLQPQPDLELSYRTGTLIPETVPPFFTLSGEHPGDIVSKIVLTRIVTDRRLREIARNLTQPWQLFVLPEMRDWNHVGQLLKLMTEQNPHTPLEIVLIEPESPADIAALEDCLRLARPLYLDNDVPFLGSRSVMFTLVTTDLSPRFGGIMKRQVAWWRWDRIPQPDEIEACSHLSGILFDNRLPQPEWRAWQDEMAPESDNFPLISFADTELQVRWMKATVAGEYYFGENRPGTG